MGASMQKPGQLIEQNLVPQATRTRTDHEGKFQLKLKTGARGIAVIHESGSALLTLAAATNNAIVLQPWGAIEGTLYLEGRPAPNQTVSVNGIQKLDTDPRVLFSFGYTTTTDDRGRFRFNQVLPGEHSLVRSVGVADSGPSEIHPDHSTQVKVESGAVATVELRGQGREVIGRIVLTGSPQDVQWGMSSAMLKGTNSFPFAMSKDGAIRADDVPPGTYTLAIDLRSPSAEPLMYSKTFGSLQQEVVVPPAEDVTVPVNLGDLTIVRAK
jgi:hypothetical protein